MVVFFILRNIIMIISPSTTISFTISFHHLIFDLIDSVMIKFQKEFIIQLKNQLGVVDYPPSTISQKNHLFLCQIKMMI